MRALPAPGELEQIDVADQGRAHISVRILKRVAYPRLRPEMDDAVMLQARQAGLERGQVGEVRLDEAEGVAVPALELGDPVALQLNAVIIVDVVEADHRLAAPE